MEYRDERDQFKKYVKIGIFGGVAGLLLILALINCYTVDTGEVAIISTFGKITRVETEGLHLKIPFVQGKTFMETREKTYIFGKTEEMDTTMEVSTKDMQSIKLEFTVQASITDPEILYRAFNNKHEQRLGDVGFIFFLEGNVSKYLIRAEKKNGKEDYEKAKKYLSWLVDMQKVIPHELAFNSKEKIAEGCGTDWLNIIGGISIDMKTKKALILNEVFNQLYSANYGKASELVDALLKE